MSELATPADRSLTGGIGPRYAPREVLAHYRADDCIILRSCVPLGDTERNIVNYLDYWAEHAPSRGFLAQRSADRSWDMVTYGEAWQRVQGIAQGLIDAGVGTERPILILSGASIEHALLMLAAMLVGTPVAPVSPSYSLLPDARSKLVDIVDLTEPEMVFVQSEAPFAPVRDLPGLASARWICAGDGERARSLADWYALEAGSAVAERRAAVTPDTIGKILFTSGSTGKPKGVINSQRMLCNAICSTVGLVLDGDEPPVYIDWMPWHHTMGGNAVLHGTLRTGGTFYIDDGRPTPELFGRTLENIRDVRPTMLQSVPAAFVMMVTALEKDAGLREAFFSRVDRLISAGASLPQDIWHRMQTLAIQTRGRQVDFGSAFGTTETGPGVSITHWPSQGSGEIGLPVAGAEIKLLPVDDRYEIRVRGPNVMPGYYRQPELTAAAFDEEGFYRTGDLVMFVDPANPAAGLRFGGRLSENFKLANGSWVATGELRLAVLEACSPLVGDLVLAGADREDVRAMLWPGPGQTLDADKDWADLASKIAGRLAAFNGRHSGATHRIAAFRMLREPPSMGSGETTDKGYINQRGVLARRAALVDALYSPADAPDIVTLPPPRA